MEEEKRYYWLKLHKDFFQGHQIRILEGMPNGKEYAYFLLKLLAESVSHDGKLRLSETIPYNEEMLSALTNTNVDIVRSAIKAFEALGLLEIMDDGTYYLTEVKRLTGSETEWAEKKRLYREKLKEQGQLEDKGGHEEDIEGQCQDKKGQCPIRDKSKEIRDKSKDIKKDIRKKDREAVIVHLNDKLGTQYREAGKTSELINARMDEGYTVDDFTKVIDTMCDEWLGDPKMEQFLRPSTLFSKTHFPEYLNRKPKKKVTSSYEDDDFHL